MAEPRRSATVALTGLPNSGKSTLLNTLVGEKLAAVSQMPQTTRGRILGVVNRAGVQLAFLDTPGVHLARHALNQRMLHHVDIELLRGSYQNLKRGAAAGVDGVTWQEYGDGLEERLVDLHGRIHRGAYRAKPSRRVWIPKADGRQRPLGIAALEDKIVQHAVGRVLNQIWEEDFLGFSYGFRPGRGSQDALDALWVGIVRKKVNWIVDLDIRSFLDPSTQCPLSHEITQVDHPLL